MNDTFSIALQHVLSALVPVLAMAEVASGRDLSNLGDDGYVEMLVKLAGGDESSILIEAVTPTERIILVSAQIIESASLGVVQ